MDRLTATRVFVTVVEQGSLTQAADVLDMSTAMVSRYLAAMEGWLGARLLHRTTRRLGLTDAGQASLASCRALLELADETRHLAAETRRVPTGRLRIASSPSFAEAQLASALVEFQRRHDQVTFTLMTADRTVDLVAERIDLAVRITNSLDPALIARPLATCRSVLCASPRYLRKHGRPRTLESLASHACLVHAQGGPAQFRFHHRGELVEPTITERFAANETVVLRRAVLDGGGIAILPTYFVGEDLREGRLVRVLPDVEPEVLGVHALFLSRQHQPLALRLLVDFLAERFGGDAPPWDA